MKKLSFLYSIDIHPSWNKFLNKDIISLLEEIENKIKEKQNYTPQDNKVLLFLEMDLQAIPVLILGQDPYPQNRVATGRCFEVAGLNSWSDKFRNVSLKNIVRSIYKSKTGEEKKYSEILPFINQGDKITTPGEFRILPPNKLFKYWWEHENVLLLNTAFTCIIGKANSHTKLWADFTSQLLNYISCENKNIVWLLWGKNAQKIVDGINIVNKIENTHPMMCYKREHDFLFGETNPFISTSKSVNWTGIE